MENEQLRPLTEAEIEEAEGLCAMVSKGLFVYVARNKAGESSYIVAPLGESVLPGIAKFKEINDASFFIHAPQWIFRLLADWRRMEAEIGAWENRYGEFGKKHITAQLAGQIVAAKLDGARAALKAAELEFSPGDYIQTGEHPAATIRALVGDDEWLAALLEDR